jgi:tetratricopeptide (TPR) repeat protein
VPEPKHPSQSGRPAAERQFVGREEFVAPVHVALKEPRRTKPLVLVYYGGAGIGKSRLRLELTKQMDAEPGVLTTALDFAIPSYRQPESALLFLRNTLHGAYQVKFPSFDLAYAYLWQKSHPDAPLASGDMTGIAAIPDRVPKEASEPDSLLSQLLDESGKLPLIGLIPKVAKLLAAPLDPSTTRPLDHFLSDWWTERGERELEDLPQMEPAAIVERMPKLWAADLKDALRATSFKPQATSREEGGERREESHVRNDGRTTMNDERATRKAVLFIDAYEQLWQTVDAGQQAVGSRQETGDRRQKTDEWVRELVKQLPEALWVICGRQKLHWEEVEPDWNNSLSQHELKALSDQSSRQFLASCGIASEPIQDAIVKGSQGVPHYLDLAVDTVQSARCKVQDAEFGGDNPDELVKQFVRHLDRSELEALQVLSAPRYWYYGLFENLMSEYETGYPATAYDELGRFSFVSEGAAAETWTMHELMREALQEAQPPELRKRVHLFLHELYAKQLEGLDAKNITDKHRAALTEAFYHGRQAKSASGLWVWLGAASDVFDKAGKFRLLTPLFREAAQALETEVGPNHPDTATALWRLATELADLGEYAEAEPLHRRSLAIREKVLGPEHPDVAKSLNDLARMLYSQCRYADAEPLYRRALAVREKALV